jgi:hypothetical protein
MNVKKISMLAILSLSIAAVTMGTAGSTLISTVFAGGDHHHGHDSQKCKDNDNNNCNNSHRTQKNKSKLDCKIDLDNKDSENDILAQSVQCNANNSNQKDVVQLNSTVFGDIFGSGI